MVFVLAFVALGAWIVLVSFALSEMYGMNDWIRDRFRRTNHST